MVQWSNGLMVQCSFGGEVVFNFFGCFGCCCCYTTGLRDALHLKITSLVSQNVAMSEIIHVGTFFRAAARRSLRWFGWVCSKANPRPNLRPDPRPETRGAAGPEGLAEDVAKGLQEEIPRGPSIYPKGKIEYSRGCPRAQIHLATPD